MKIKTLYCFALVEKHGQNSATFTLASRSGETGPLDNLATLVPSVDLELLPYQNGVEAVIASNSELVRAFNKTEFISCQFEFIASFKNRIYVEEGMTVFIDDDFQKAWLCIFNYPISRVLSAVWRNVVHKQIEKLEAKLLPIPRYKQRGNSHL